MIEARVAVLETCIDARVEEGLLPLVQGAVARARGVVESKIGACPGFGASLTPVPEEDGDHPLIRRMCRAAALAGVGPMASVAGAVASHAACELVSAGSREFRLDNGGDVAVLSPEAFTVGLYTGDRRSDGLVLELGPTDSVLGICSSSARVGHSFSFGRADIATVVSPDPVLADACATALCNSVRSVSDLADATEGILSVPGVTGCLAVIDGVVSVCGDIPDPRRVRMRPPSVPRRTRASPHPRDAARTGGRGPPPNPHPSAPNQGRAARRRGLRDASMQMDGCIIHPVSESK